MILPLVLVFTLFVIFTTEVLLPKKEEKKTPEQELKDAIAKYVSQAMKLPKE